MEGTKSVVSISEMARMVGLSRARFYQLIGSTFPWPVYSVSTRRPFYDQLLQEECLGVRRRNCGIDGRPVLFYTKRISNSVPVRRTKKAARIPRPSKANSDHDDILTGLRSLGLATATSEQVAVAVKELVTVHTPGSNEGVDW